MEVDSGAKECAVRPKSSSNPSVGNGTDRIASCQYAIAISLGRGRVAAVLTPHDWRRLWLFPRGGPKAGVDMETEGVIFDKVVLDLEGRWVEGEGGGPRTQGKPRTMPWLAKEVMTNQISQRPRRQT
jgi:hypothetical protein